MMMGFFGFGKKENIADMVNALPSSGITVLSLKALDFIVPGGWSNYTNFDEMLRSVTRENDETFLASVKNRAIELYEDSSQGYQSAMRLYRLVDSTDKALGTAALADKMSEKFSLLSFLTYLTPKADKAQVIDLTLKLIAELLAFTKINGIPGDSFNDFIKALGEYAGESRMRMAGLVCFDGLIPLGAGFINFSLKHLENFTPSELADNTTFKSMRDEIPGDNDSDKLGFIRRGFVETQGWMKGFIAEHHLSANTVIDKIRAFVDVTEDKLDYLAAFLDISTNYFEHTGTQTLAARLIERAVNEI